MRIGSLLALLLFISGIVLIIVQMWFSIFERVLFLKIFVTLALLFVIVLSVTLVIRDYFEERDMRDSGHLD